MYVGTSGVHGLARFLGKCARRRLGRYIDTCWMFRETSARPRGLADRLTVSPTVVVSTVSVEAARDARQDGIIDIAIVTATVAESERSSGRRARQTKYRGPRPPRVVCARMYAVCLRE